MAKFCARFSLTVPSLAAKNAKTVEMNRPAPGSSFKTPSAKTASRRRDRPRQALAKPRAAHGDDPRRSSADRGRLAVVTSRNEVRKDPAASLSLRLASGGPCRWNERQSYIAGASAAGAFVR